MASNTALETGHFHQDHQTLSGTKHNVRSQKCQQQQQQQKRGTGYQKYKTTNKINMYMHYFSQLNE